LSRGGSIRAAGLTIRNLFVSTVFVAPLFGVHSFPAPAQLARVPFIAFCAINIVLL
jgi:hypothetical protein